jgi:hypothetical protein
MIRPAKQLAPWRLVPFGIFLVHSAVAGDGVLGYGGPAKPVVPGESTAYADKQASFWRSVGNLPDLWDGTWQGVSDMYDSFAGAQYTPAMQQYIAQYKPPDDSTFANCKPPGMPFVMNIVAMPMKFFPAPNMIALYLEDFGQTRFIHMDGRQHSVHLNPTYLGESIGHWEGDTLVVDTTGLVDDSLYQVGMKAITHPAGLLTQPSAPIFAPHGPHVRFVERMRMTDFNTLTIQTTVYDEAVFAKPFSFNPRIYHRYTAVKNEPQEWVCSENHDQLDENGNLRYDVPGK